MNGKKTWTSLALLSLAMLGDAAQGLLNDGVDFTKPTDYLKAIAAVGLFVGTIHKLIKGE